MGCSGTIKIISITVQSLSLATPPDLKIIFFGHSLLQLSTFYILFKILQNWEEGCMFTMSQLLHSGSISAPPRATGPGRLCRTFFLSGEGELQGSRESIYMSAGSQAGSLQQGQTGRLARGEGCSAMAQEHAELSGHASVASGCHHSGISFLRITVVVRAKACLLFCVIIQLPRPPSAIKTYEGVKSEMRQTFPRVLPYLTSGLQADNQAAD